MGSACFGFSLYGRECIGCVPGETTISKRCRENAPESSLDEEKISTYSVSVALRVSIALGSQPRASSVPEAEEKIRINFRADIKVWGVSSGESSVALES